MQVYWVQWECTNCGRQHRFRRGFNPDDGWPNEFEDLECENDECRHVQDVPFRACTVEPVEGAEEF